MSLHFRISKRTAPAGSDREDAAGIIAAGFAIIIPLCLLPAFFAGWAVEHTTSIMKRFFAGDEKIAELSLTSLTQMVKVRRNEKDFLLSFREFGFNEAKARYITTLESSIDDIHDNMEHIRALTKNTQIRSKTEVIDRSLLSYEKQLDQYVDLYASLGNETSGLESGFRRAGLDGLFKRTWSGRATPG